jgi:hypothetical protein
MGYARRLGDGSDSEHWLIKVKKKNINHTMKKNWICDEK